ncbi:MAG TPA: gluconate 2-dehydrogenase subunit 3 family protein [Bryobacteraceae bacterium]|nr:gluconate 2-dehydrogenase subunit 3 family protein [Bryobacteraceae bacterium]
MPPEEKSANEISRRAVIASAAIVPVAALTAAAQQPDESALSATQIRTLEAFVERIIPKDELGPGAAESGVAVYINRSLGDYLKGEKAAFVEGLEATDAYAKRSHGRAFVELSPDQQDAVLTAMDDGKADGFANAQAFFARTRRLTLEGMFGDPYYGGNKNFAGWDLIRYPGPRMATSPDDQKLGVAIKPVHMSAYGAKYGH